MASIDFDVEDYLDEVSTINLKEELRNRSAGIFDVSGVLKLSSTEIHQFLSEVFDVSPCLSNDDLLKEIKERLQ